MTDVLPDELRGKSVDDLAPDKTPDELRGMTPDEMTAWLDVADAWLRSIHQTDEGELRDKSPDEQTAFDYLLALRDKAVARIEENRAIQAVFRNRPKAVETAMFVASHKDDAYASVRRMPTPEARDRALRVLDGDRISPMTDPQRAQVEKYIRKNTDIARRVIVTENDAYRDAWMKMVTEPQAAAFLTDEERDAMRAWNEYRAMSENVTTAGGFGLPVFIDPSVILTAQETENPFLTLAAQQEINTNIWKGVSSAGVTWAFQTEAAATTDNSPTLAQPSVTVHMARGFIPFSIEVGQDYPGFADQMSNLLSAGYNELIVDKFTRGSGVGEPQGLLTALSANTNVRVVVGGAPAISTGDPYKVWAALPQKYRTNASWLMDITVNNAIRQLGTSTQFHAFTGTLREEWLDILFRKAVYESPYMPGTTTTTAATTGLAVVGNFQNYLIARRGGMSVELIPALFDVTNNRPTGQRGWFAYARIGGGSINDLGFRLLVNA